jgi:hypothetical protein
MTKKCYNYILAPEWLEKHLHENHLNAFKDAFSSMKCNSINQAYAWAKVLLTCNPTQTGVFFRADNGSKTYYLIKEANIYMRGDTTGKDKVTKVTVTVTFERDYTESVNEMLEEEMVMDWEDIKDAVLEWAMEDMNDFPAWLKDEDIKIIIE